MVQFLAVALIEEHYVGAQCLRALGAFWRLIRKSALTEVCGLVHQSLLLQRALLAAKLGDVTVDLIVSQLARLREVLRLGIQTHTFELLVEEALLSSLVVQVIDILGHQSDILASCKQVIDESIEAVVGCVRLGFNLEFVEFDQPLPAFVRVVLKIVQGQNALRVLFFLLACPVATSSSESANPTSS